MLPQKDPCKGAVKTRRGTRHDRLGCLTCRQRRKKCVENTYPVCGACLRLNLECVRQPVRRVVSPSMGSARFDPPRPAGSPTANGTGTVCPLPVITLRPTASLSLGLGLGLGSAPGQTQVQMDPSQKRHVMRYYITVLTLHLTVSEQFNSFLSVFLPMAMESAALSDALVAFASGHLSLVDSSYRVAALQARAAAIRNHTTAISTPPDHLSWHEINAATCLAFSIGEICTSSESKASNPTWYTHLEAAKHIIMSAGGGGPEGLRYLQGPEALKGSPEGQWVLRNFAYHDIVGSITLRRRPLLDDGKYLDVIDEISHGVVDSYLGVAVGLLRFIAEIGRLEEDTRPLVGDMEDVRERKTSLFHATCARLEQQLQDWRCSAETATSLASMAYCFRSAVLILLYRLARRRLDEEATESGNNADTDTDSGSALDLSKTVLADILQTKIRAQVTETLDYVSNITAGTGPESAVLFPLFIAGAETADDGQIRLVRARLRGCLDKRRFQNIARALEILEEVWGSRKLGGQAGSKADWIHILEASGEELALT